MNQEIKWHKKQQNKNTLQIFFKQWLPLNLFLIMLQF